eukprot:Skav218844  [mRNA]  locus=scaffold3958:45653:60387:+ [translate_table: standard]
MHIAIEEQHDANPLYANVSWAGAATADLDSMDYLSKEKGNQKSYTSESKLEPGENIADVKHSGTERPSDFLTLVSLSRAPGDDSYKQVVGGTGTQAGQAGCEIFVQKDAQQLKLLKESDRFVQDKQAQRAGRTGAASEEKMPDQVAEGNYEVKEMLKKLLAQWPKDVLDLGREGVEKRAKLERLTGNIDIWWIVGGGGVLELSRVEVVDDVVAGMSRSNLEPLPDDSVPTESMRHLAWYKERHFPERLAQWASDPPMLTAEDASSRVFTIWSQILWHSDGESKLLCYEPLPQCSDGLLLKPVPIWDCPPVNEVLPGSADRNLQSLAKVVILQLLETFAKVMVLPVAHVYRKEDGTTRTTSTTHSLTLTTKTSKAVMLWSSKDGWQYVGPVQNNCISSPEIPGQCTAIPPVGMPIKLVSYSSSDSGESLKIDHQESHPSDPGHSYLVGSERSRSSVASSWEFCAHEAICTDGLTLTPVTPAECPSSEDLPGCAAEPGDFWKAGECCTSDQLANCEGDAVYQKATGTTRTSTTSATRTATSTASLWQGPGSGSGACVESSNFPEALTALLVRTCMDFLREPYGFDERCTPTLAEGTVVTVISFENKDFYDRLTVNGEEYSGPNGLEGAGNCIAELFAVDVLRTSTQLIFAL